MERDLKELTILHFLNDGIRTTFVAVLPFVAKELSLNYKYVGFLSSSQSLFMTILAIPAGFVAASFGGFKTLILVLLFYSSGAILLGLSPNIYILTLAYFMGAVGFGMFHTIGFALVAKSSKHTNIGKNMANFTVIGDMGRIAVPPVVVLAASIYGWRISMLILGAIGLLTFGAFKLFGPKKDRKDLKEVIEKKENYRDFVKNTLLLFKIRKLQFLSIAAMIDAFASSPIFIFLPFILLSKGITTAQFGIITGIYFMGSLIGRKFLGIAVDKYGGAAVFTFSEIAMAILLIILISTNYLYLIAVLCFVIGSFTRGTSPIIQSMFSHLVEPNLYHKVYAASEICVGGAAATALLLTGVVAYYFGSTSVYYISACLAVMATIPIFFLKKTKA